MSNGTYTEYISDHLGRLKSLMNYKGPGAAVAPGSVISQYLSQAGDFDSVGNRLKVTTLDSTYEYNYDSIYQLKEAKANSVLTESYQYDLVGNRVGAWLAVPIQGDYLYDNNNRLESITDSTANQITYTYDDNGSRITKTENDSTTSYTYDYENRLKRIDFTDSSYAEYTYDALGRRIGKKFFSLESEVVSDFRYCYDGEDIVAVLDSTNTAIASINHGPGIDHPLAYKRLQTSDNGPQTEEIFYYHQDYLGSIIVLTDENQDIVETYKYDSYGNLLSTNDYSLTTVVYSFTGREYDQESGLYFYRARYYDSKVGRFLETDPIGFLAGVNFYAYVGNNPVRFIDPWGLCPEPWWKNKVKEWIKQHGSIDITFNAGNWLGVSGQLSITAEDISGYFGGGVGIGWGVSGTGGVNFGNSSGWGITFSYSGGGGLGGTVSGTASTGG